MADPTAGHFIQPENITDFGAFLDRLPQEAARADAMAEIWSNVFERVVNYNTGILNTNPEVKSDRSEPSAAAAVATWFDEAKQYVERFTGTLVAEQPITPDTYDSLELSVSRLLKTWSGAAADEFQQQAEYVEDFGRRVADRISSAAPSFQAAISSIAAALRKADAEYSQLKDTFAYWTGALANVAWALQEYYLKASAPLPAFPWRFSIYSFQEFLAAGFEHRDLSVRVQDTGSGAMRAVRLEGAISGGSATLTLGIVDGSKFIFRYQGTLQGYIYSTLTTEYGLRYSLTQDAVRDNLRNPELYAAASPIVSGPGGLAEQFAAIKQPKPADGSKLPSLARTGWPVHASALGTLQSDSAPPSQ